MERVSAAHALRRGQILFFLTEIPFGKVFLSQISSKSVNSALPAAGASVIDTEFIILENIYDSSSQILRQRDLAQIAGASLGMTNSILKRLALKGLITVKKLNSRNIQYAVTLEGINEIIHRSYRYFKRTIRNVVYYKDSLEEVVSRARRRNIKTVILVGSSDLDFIVEHACRRLGMSYKTFPENQKINKTLLSEALVIYAENITESSTRYSPVQDPAERMSSAQNSYYLSRLIIKQATRVELGGIY